MTVGAYVQVTSGSDCTNGMNFTAAGGCPNDCVEALGSFAPLDEACGENSDLTCDNTQCGNGSHQQVSLATGEICDNISS